MLIPDSCSERFMKLVESIGALNVLICVGACFCWFSRLRRLQVSSHSLLQIGKEVKEMTLLVGRLPLVTGGLLYQSAEALGCYSLAEIEVDATTPLLDVDQAHLSFVRRRDSDDSSMPSLRRLVQPTDAGTRLRGWLFACRLIHPTI